MILIIWLTYYLQAGGGQAAGFSVKCERPSPAAGPVPLQRPHPGHADVVWQTQPGRGAIPTQNIIHLTVLCGATSVIKGLSLKQVLVTQLNDWTRSCSVILQNFHSHYHLRKRLSKIEVIIFRNIHLDGWMMAQMSRKAYFKSIFFNT